MYKIGDHVVKASIGLCRIDDIMHLEGNNVDKNKLYYLLIPMSDEKMKVYVPVDQGVDAFRKALDADQAWAVINKIPQIEEMHIENEKQREQKYKEAIRSCDPESLVSIIKNMYMRRQKRTMQGKKTTEVDEHYFRLAEEYLYSELAFAIGKNKDEMCELISKSIH